MGETKYNNGSVQDIEDIPQEEMSLAISEWAEGNKNLQGAISSCIENGIPTIASCAGHSLTDSPYLAMRINRENIGKILNIINVFTNQPNTSIVLSFDKNDSALTIYGNRFNKNKCFETIAREAQNSLDLENTNDITRSLWNTHFSLETHRYDMSTRFYHSILYENSVARKRLIISPFGNKVLGQILTEAGMKSANTAFRSTVMQKSSIGRRGIIDTLDRVCYELRENMCESLDDNEFTRGKVKSKMSEVDHVKEFSDKMQAAAQKEQQDVPNGEFQQGSHQDVTDNNTRNTDGIDRGIDD